MSATATRGGALAVLAVAVCLAALLVPLASDSSSADEYYSYTITSNGTIEGSYTAIAGSASDSGDYTSSPGTNEGTWGFDPDTGLGPFNSFYAAFDPYNGNAIVGVLDPYNLEYLIDGGYIGGQSYNIMWVLPTVYWSVDETTGNLTLTNNPEGGTAYAHTLDGYTYEYIAYGVYEASTTTLEDGTTVLTSTSGKNPSYNQTRATFREYAANGTSENVVSMQWNFYQYELYKYCCVAVMNSWDSQGVAGNGCTYGSSKMRTGQLDAAGPYAGTKGDATNNVNCASSVKVFIENAWGSVSEYVDGVVVHVTSSIYIEQASVPTDSTDPDEQYVTQVPLTTTRNITGAKFGSSPSTAAEVWGFPTASDGSATDGLYDGYYTGGTGDYTLIVGGASAVTSTQKGGYGGLSCVNMYNGVSAAESLTGARLAFAFDSATTTAALSYDDNGGTGDIAGGSGTVQSIEDGLSVEISKDEPTLYGYKFLGWARSSDATEADYQPGDTVQIWEDTTLYAVWEIVEFTINLTYEDNEGNGGPGSTTWTGTVNNDLPTISSVEPSRDGYTFLGWATSSDATEAEYTGGKTLNIEFDSDVETYDVTLYAVWLAEGGEGEYTFTLDYDANGGIDAPDPESYTASEDSYVFTVSDVEPTRDGYTFLGWSTDADATAAEYLPGGSITITSDGSLSTSVTLYAVWESDGDDGGKSGDGGGRSGPVYSYTVIYDANGGTGAPEAQRYTSSSTSATIIITSSEPTRSGYTFLGWSADPSATSAEYHSMGSITLTSDGSFSTSVTLYAVWTADSSSGSGSGDGESGSRSGTSGDGGSDGGSGDSDWWVWVLIIVVIILVVAIAAWMGYRARIKG